MSDAIFVANKASGHLAIGDRKEMDKATWRKPRGIRLTPTPLTPAPNVSIWAPLRHADGH
jgi:hypothetical protein